MDTDSHGLDHPPVGATQRENDILNGAQRTSLTLTLRRLEEELTHMLPMFDRGEVVARLTPDGARHARTLAERQLAIIGELTHRFDLPLESTDDIRRMVAVLTLSWNQLHDSKSRTLRRYGEVDPTLAQRLDPDLDQLIQLVMSLIRALEKWYQP